MSKLRSAITFMPVAVILAWAAPAAADAQRGRLLVENHCQSCHSSGVHLRTARKATSPAELRAYIARWSTELKLNWQDADREDVYDHLNSRYYRFAPASKP